MKVIRSVNISHMEIFHLKGEPKTVDLVPTIDLAKDFSWTNKSGIKYEQLSVSKIIGNKVFL